jgi:S-adenosylmethionine-diacylgycerolhomoserine-N-methlytransferase
VSDGTGHGALMDRVYRNQRYIYDLTRKYYLLGRDRLVRELAPRAGARVVEIGCGTARNLIAMAQLYPDARLFGLDASSEMLKTAERAIAKAGLSGRIKLAHGYAEELTPALFGENAPFDDAVFSYSLSMIPDWRQALRRATDALGPDGRLHIVDFGDLTGLSRPLRAALLGWLRLFHVAPRAELLGALECGAGKISLRVLPGRYAFILTAERGNLPALTAALTPV